MRNVRREDRGPVRNARREDRSPVPVAREKRTASMRLAEAGSREDAVLCWWPLAMIPTALRWRWSMGREDAVLCREAVKAEEERRPRAA